MLSPIFCYYCCCTVVLLESYSKSSEYLLSPQKQVETFTFGHGGNQVFHLSLKSIQINFWSYVQSDSIFLGHTDSLVSVIEEHQVVFNAVSGDDSSVENNAKVFLHFSFSL